MSSVLRVLGILILVAGLGMAALGGLAVVASLAAGTLDHAAVGGLVIGGLSLVPLTAGALIYAAGVLLARREPEESPCRRPPPLPRPRMRTAPEDHPGGRLH